jgi:2-amino-4-hydroxy-6-hydroxymethyldihydropteridine diphosphokinase
MVRKWKLRVGNMRNNRVFIGLGSNLGNREENIYNALRLMHYYPTINVIETSAIYETEPVGVNGHPDYLNMAVEILTSQNPEQLLKVLQSIEDNLGRRGRGEMTPRTIDLDILLFGNKIVKTESLIIPHPRLTERKFVLQMLLDIDPTLRHPTTGMLIKKHFDKCKDTTRCTLFRK